MSAVNTLETTTQWYKVKDDIFDADKKDAEIAAKIDKNADDITLLVKEMIDTTATGMVDFILKI